MPSSFSGLGHRVFISGTGVRTPSRVHQKGVSQEAPFFFGEIYMESINIAIVGCGAHSHLHANAAESFSNIKITSCCDIDSFRSNAWAEKYKCRPYTSITEMISAEKPDAVILCTWPNQHLEQIKECLSAGIKYILCEKSLTITSEDA